MQEAYSEHQNPRILRKQKSRAKVPRAPVLAGFRALEVAALSNVQTGDAEPIHLADVSSRPAAARACGTPLRPQ